MIGIGIANSLGVNLSGLSPAAKSFVTAAGISDPTKVKAINDLVIGLQSSGLWSKMKAVYPFVTDNRNLLSYTDNFANGFWGVGNGAVKTPNFAAAPDGTITACRFNGGGFLNSGAVNVVAGTNVFSFYAKTTSGGTSTIRVFLDGGTTTTTKTITGTWTRIETTQNFASNQAVGVGFYLDSSDLLIWHPQVELGSTATTYQPIATTQQAFISNQFKYNLKDPRDTDAAFRLVFNGGWSFSSTGATPNGVNGYADTKLNPLSVFGTGYPSQGSYYRETFTAGQTNIDGCMITSRFDMGYDSGVTTPFVANGSNNSDTSVDTDNKGLIIATRQGASVVKMFRNNILKINGTQNFSSNPNVNYFIAARNNAGSPQLFSNSKSIAFKFIGDGLTDDDATNLYYYTQVFQTTLGRQVGSPAYALPTTYDASAKLYLSAIGSTTDSTLNNAVDTFIKGLKADGIYSKMKAVYPFATDNRNLIDYSEDFSNALWNKGGATISANSIIAPNGTLTADKLNEDNTNAAHYASFATGKMLTTNTYTVSAYLKAGERIWGAVYLYTGTSPLIAFFNLSNGTIGNTDAGVTATMTDVGNGWYRCTTTAIIIGSSNANGGVLNAQNNGTWIYTGTSGNGIYAWGAQLELGSTATTYQPILTTQQAYISSQFKYNMVNPQDDDSAFRLVFNGGWTHSANGATPNGTNGYADTKYKEVSGDNNNFHISTYLRTNVSGAFGDMGVVEGVKETNIVSLLTSKFFGRIQGAEPNGIANSDSRGLFMANRITSSQLKVAKNGIVTNIANNSGGISSTYNIYLNAFNQNGMPIVYSPRQTAFASIGNGLTDTEAANLYSRVQALQTALNRQV